MTGHKCSDQMYALGVSPCEEDDEFKESEVEQFGIKELTRGGHKVLMSEDDDGSTLAGATACLSVYEETTSEEQGCRR
ncbi:hypothetical protein Tco_1178685 [Tanacetum coccineum]